MITSTLIRAGLPWMGVGLAALVAARWAFRMAGKPEESLWELLVALEEDDPWSSRPPLNPDTGKDLTWADIDEALRVAKWGFPGGSSLEQLCREIEEEGKLPPSGRPSPKRTPRRRTPPASRTGSSPPKKTLGGLSPGRPTKPKRAPSRAGR